ncbi:MAG TPA: hypothetical protein VLT62_26405, partial [Candidatus Methylomirabilis sp.]|nr:hypothetical protein [Candidatus Methylomirabilis sp.]
GGPVLPGGAEGSFRVLPSLVRAHLAEGIRAAFLFGLTAVALGVPVSLLVPNLSPTRLPTGPAGSAVSSSSSAIE